MTLPPFLDRIVPGRRIHAGDAGIVDEDVDAAEQLDSLVAGLFDSSKIGDIDGDRSDAAALGQFRGGLLAKSRSRSQIATEAPDSRKPLDDGAADALRATGDDREFAIQNRSCWTCSGAPRVIVLTLGMV